MAQKQHEIQIASKTLASEVSPGSDFMKRLSQIVWHDNPPFATKVPKDEAADIFATQLKSPAGLMSLIQKFGLHKVQEIQKELVRQGKLPPGVLGGEV